MASGVVGDRVWLCILLVSCARNHHGTPLMRKLGIEEEAETAAH